MIEYAIECPTLRYHFTAALAENRVSGVHMSLNPIGGIWRSTSGAGVNEKLV